MQTRPSSTRRIAALFTLCLLAASTCLTGCVPDDDLSKTVTEFNEASTKLTAAFGALVTNANTIQANFYIDSQAYSTAAIHPDAIKGSAVLTDEEIKLRTSAIDALADYTSALATLASGKDAAKVATDCNTASASLKTLTSDAQAAILHPTKGSTTPAYATPVAAAVSAMGEVLELILKHHNMEVVKRTIFKNDPQISALYSLLGREARVLYALQRQSVSFTGRSLFRDYNQARAASPPNQADILQLTDRLKQWEKDSAALDGCDPSRAIDAFKKAHDALIAAILAPKTQKKQSVAQLIASVKSFADDVTPLAQNLATLATSL